MPGPFLAHGATLTFDGTAIGFLTSLDGPEEEVEEVEVTNHDSGGRREFVFGLIDSGSISIEGRFAPENTGQALLRTSLSARTIAETVLTLVSDPVVTYTFDSFVQSLSIANPFDDASGFTATLRITGDVVEAVVP